MKRKWFLVIGGVMLLMLPSACASQKMRNVGMRIGEGTVKPMARKRPRLVAHPLPHWAKRAQHRRQ